MTEAKNFSFYKILINKHLLQVSGLCGTPFLSYLPKRSKRIYKAQYAYAEPYWCPSDVHQHGGQESMKHPELTFATTVITFPS